LGDGMCTSNVETVHAEKSHMLVCAHEVLGKTCNVLHTLQESRLCLSDWTML